MSPPIIHDGCPHGPECSCQTRHTHALKLIKAMLHAPEFMKQDVSSVRVLDLRQWFDNVDVNEATLDAFVAFANAIGCTTTWRFHSGGAVLPLLSFTYVEDTEILLAHLTAVVGTDQQYALASFTTNLTKEH